jgi:hypothetical protein
MKTTGDHTHLTRSYLSLRKTVGWIGILLPLVLMIGAYLFINEPIALKNISLYYHTGMRDVFVGVLCAIALFLFFYKGYDRLDNLAANLAGLFYRVCGVVMMASMGAILVYMWFFEDRYPRSVFEFWAESVALVAFGVSWLTKGGTLYPDAKTDNKPNESI